MDAGTEIREWLEAYGMLAMGGLAGLAVLFITLVGGTIGMGRALEWVHDRRWRQRQNQERERQAMRASKIQEYEDKLTAVANDLRAATDATEAAQAAAEEAAQAGERLEDKALAIVGEAERKAAEAEAKAERAEVEAQHAFEDLDAKEAELGKEAAEHRRVAGLLNEIQSCPHKNKVGAFYRKRDLIGPRSYVKLGDYCQDCGSVVGETLRPGQPAPGPEAESGEPDDGEDQAEDDEP